MCLSNCARRSFRPTREHEPRFLFAGLEAEIRSASEFVRSSRRDDRYGGACPRGFGWARSLSALNSTMPFSDFSQTVCGGSAAGCPSVRPRELRLLPLAKIGFVALRKKSQRVVQKKKKYRHRHPRAAKFTRQRASPAPPWLLLGGEQGQPGGAGSARCLVDFAAIA